MGCEAKYELTKKRCQGGVFLSEIEVFGQEKGIIYVIYQISDKIESNKGCQKFLAVKWKFFPKKVHTKISVPPKSAPSLRQCATPFLYKHKGILGLYAASVISTLPEWMMITTNSWICIGPWGHVTSSRIRPDLGLETLWLRWWQPASRDWSDPRRRSRARDRARSERFLLVASERWPKDVVSTSDYAPIANRILCKRYLWIGEAN